MAGCCASQEDISAIQNMFEGSVTPDACELAFNDAQLYLENVYCIDANGNRLYTVMLRWYACHVLYMWGLNQRVTAKSVTDLSETRKDLNLGEKEGESPYLTEFRKFLNPDDFFLAV